MKRLLLLTALLCLTLAGQAQKHTFAVGDGTFLLDGKPFVVKAAEVHYPRIPRPYWEHRIRMCKALGMNTLCLYVFWNIHEQREGEYDFTGQNDVAEFCRIAQRNGMYVIVRPGPYVCAEWEMGGLPWWLLKKKDIRLREQDPYFMESVRRFEQKVGEQLAPLTVEHGGPIIMVQVENEYGSYGEDKAYVSAIRDCLREVYGPTLTLFQCDWASNFEKNGLDDLLWTMNFGTGANIDNQFARLRQLRPNSPLMCSEFWSGWFDKWGARHETRKADDMVAGIDEMLSKGISFSLYMTHGGTSFGHWAGANSPGFAPDVTSYDYDAPIDEQGKPTEKYWLLRETMAKYSEGKLPTVPKAPAATIRVPQFEVSEYAPMLIADDRHYRESRDVMTMEDLDMGWGYMLYETTLPEVPTQSLLTISDAHDYAQVFVDNEYIGKIDRVRNEKSIVMPPTRKDCVLRIVVEAMGRINFGRAIKDFKGITGEVTLTADAGGHKVVYHLKNWQQTGYESTYESASCVLDEWLRNNENEIERRQGAPDTPGDYGNKGYYRGYFKVVKVGDTFLNMERWGKGQVWVNGHALGRFWSIGPQQTLYVPGCWLKKGKNEVVVLDLVGPRETVAWCQDTPELNKLQLEQTTKHNNPGDRPDLNSVTPTWTGTLAKENGWQRVNFDSPAHGRFLAIECRGTHAGDAAAIAELYLLDNGGHRLSREAWTVKYASSENDRANHTGDKVFDLQESTYWQTEKTADLPHLLVIDLGEEHDIGGLEYLPRAEEGVPGAVSTCSAYIY